MTKRTSEEFAATAAQRANTDFDFYLNLKNKDHPDHRFAGIIWYVKRFLTAFENDKAQFCADVMKDAGYALSWSKEFFEKSAKEEVYKVVLAHWERGATFEEAKEMLTAEALRRARWPEQSTSPTSNFQKQCVSAAYADFAADFDNK